MADILSVGEVAEIARVSKQAVALACANGQLPAEKKSDVWIIESAAALAWVEARATELRERSDEAAAALREAKRAWKP